MKLAKTQRENPACVFVIGKTFVISHMKIKLAWFYLRNMHLVEHHRMYFDAQVYLFVFWATVHLEIHLSSCCVRLMNLHLRFTHDEQQQTFTVSLWLTAILN